MKCNVMVPVPLVFKNNKKGVSESPSSSPEATHLIYLELIWFKRVNLWDKNRNKSTERILQEVL